MSKPTVGKKIASFKAATTASPELRSRDLLGRPYVLYFYPKDDTPGCTTQACDLRDAMPTFRDLDAVVLGVSPDSVASHRKFRDKFGLNYPLLADEDHRVAEAYGVWKERSMYGRTSMGIERSTFLIDEDGKIQEAWRKVSPKGHADLLQEALQD
jgi:peroxiredoxin Q/BCP